MKKGGNSILIIFILLLCFSLNAQAQKIKKEDFVKIDAYVQTVGALDGCSLKFICDSITKNSKNELEISRAFYYWLSHQISFDFNRKKHPQKTDNASTALMERKAASKGFAEIFQAMCQLKNLKCRLVKGWVRYRLKDLGKMDDNEEHYWNIITLNNTDYIIDVAWSMGVFDEKGKRQIRQYTDAWWLCNRSLFAFSHLPKNPQDQLLEVPITKRVFANKCLVFPVAIVAGLVPSANFSATHKGIAGDTIAQRFQMAPGFRVYDISIQFDDLKPQALVFDISELGFYIQCLQGPVGKGIARLLLGSNVAFVYQYNNRKAIGARKK